MTLPRPQAWAATGLLLALVTGVALGWRDAAPAVTEPGPAAAASAIPTVAASSPGPAAEAMVAQLEVRLKEHPDDREGWMMLARAYGVMGRDADAVTVFRRLLAQSPPDPVSLAQAHADLGRVLGRANGRRLSPEADEHLQKALQLDPANVMAHALLGRVALERGDAADARRHWQQALAGVDNGHPFAQQLRQSIELADSILSNAASAPRS